jgi:NAD(P)-dependent dehydrogenase (short-subunit alcohol dehydrogenase family)
MSGSMTRLSGVVIVTGAASGLGRESATHFADCGAMVVAVDINRQGLDEIAAPRIEPFVADITKSVECEAVVKRAAELGPITGLLNSAGIELHGSVIDMPEESWDRVMNVNLKAIFLLSKHVIPHMIANGSGSVVNMSSVQALATQAGVAAYAATKGAVLSLTRVMALDHGKDNIRVTAICPGTIDTPLARANAEHWNPGNPAAVLEEWGSKHALNRIGRPIEVARLAAFLISEESSFITGSHHLVDGGLLASF